MLKPRQNRKIPWNFLFPSGICTAIVITIVWASSKDETDYQLSCNVLQQVSDVTSDVISSISYVEVSNRAHLSIRAACSIESAAVHHPQWSVILYNTSYIADDQVLQLLNQLPNFRLQSLNLSKMFEQTPLHNWYSSGDYHQGPYWVEKLSDAIRLLLLWTWGGIYLDTDVIVLRSMATLRNVIGLETLQRVNGAIMAFDKNNSFLYECMENFQRSFSPFIWGTEGPALLTKTVLRSCSVNDLYQIVSENKTCTGVNVLPWHSFYPLPWPIWPKLFSVVSDYEQLLSCSYTIHLWNSMSKNRHSQPGSYELLDVLARQNCPKVYQLMTNHFKKV